MKTHGIVRITKDLEVKYSQSNVAILRFSVAQNDYKREGHFFKCVAFNKNAENIAKYFSKGDRIYIEGDLWNNNYEKDGVMVYQDVITVQQFEFIENKTKQDNTQDNKQDYAQEYKQFKQKQEEQPKIDNGDSSLPF